MGVPKRKTSKMKKKFRQGANRYEGIEVGICTSCKAPVLPHKACSSCGNYNGKQVITIKE
ncbi:MAG TPA: 50S ribosomal protein L32 [Lentisphaeria bacterium]|nr:MAG: 50S ribosomal protein L32 [Lentisphaerae bacterium GWF2_38_69]HBM16475.1 50S ribosomal protein L32 [Lentisphaeria bacterium]